MSTPNPNPAVNAKAARPPKGEVLRRPTRSGDVFALRFTAYGKRRHAAFGVITEAEAEAKLSHIMADVERGIWQPPAKAEAPPLRIDPGQFSALSGIVSKTARRSACASYAPCREAFFRL
jgi:hypothetical protein